MKLCTFALASPLGELRRVGVVVEEGIVDATAARIALLENTLPSPAARRVGEAQVPADMLQLIGSGAEAIQWLCAFHPRHHGQ